MIIAPTSLLRSLPQAGREHLLASAREVHFPADTRLFDEGDTADRFWIVRTGAVTLDIEVPGRHRPVTLETLHPGDLVGWSWLTPPFTWHMGAEALSPVRALEFDAAEVRGLCEADPELGRVLACRLVEIVGNRLQQARTRLADDCGPHRPGYREWS